MTTIQFTKQAKGRKQLAALIATHLNAEAEYLGTPSFAYQIGEATLDRDWQLYLPDDADTTGLVESAAQAGFSTDEPEGLGVSLAFPTTGWDETTVGKVEATLSAKGHLIAKALQIPVTPMNIDEKAGTVEFPWFGHVPDPEVVEAATVLIARIIEHAKVATRVSAKPAKTGGNDKYAMRCWLLRLGMIGEGYKHVRRVLLTNLGGNAAWKTPPHNQGRLMRANAEGQRIRLVSTTDPYTNLKPDDEGIVAFVDDAGTVHVAWDCGSNLGLIPGEDRWEYLPGTQWP